MKIRLKKWIHYSTAFIHPFWLTRTNPCILFLCLFIRRLHSNIFAGWTIQFIEITIFSADDFTNRYTWIRIDEIHVRKDEVESNKNWFSNKAWNILDFFPRCLGNFPSYPFHSSVQFPQISVVRKFLIFFALSTLLLRSYSRDDENPQ